MEFTDERKILNSFVSKKYVQLVITEFTIKQISALNKEAPCIIIHVPPVAVYKLPTSKHINIREAETLASSTLNFPSLSRSIKSTLTVAL